MKIASFHGRIILSELLGCFKEIRSTRICQTKKMQYISHDTTPTTPIPIDRCTTMLLLILLLGVHGTRI